MDKTKPATSFKAVGSTPASASTSKFDQPAKEGIESDGNSPPSFPSIPDNDGCALTAADLTPRELEVEAAIAASLKGKGKDATPVTEEKFGSEDAEGEDDPEVLDEMQEISSNGESSQALFRLSTNKHKTPRLNPTTSMMIPAGPRDSPPRLLRLLKLQRLPNLTASSPRSIRRI